MILSLGFLETWDEYPDELSLVGDSLVRLAVGILLMEIMLCKLLWIMFWSGASLAGAVLVWFGHVIVFW